VQAFEVYSVLPRNHFALFCRCIAVVHEEQIWASTEHLEYIIEALSSSARTRVIDAKGQNLLTPRENQVANLVAQGIGGNRTANSASKRTR
jgi:hypothetical protein